MICKALAVAASHASLRALVFICLRLYPGCLPEAGGFSEAQTPAV